MTTTSTMFDLPEELVEEILSRVTMTSLRSVRLSCKKWNALSKKRILGKAATSQFLGFTTWDSRVCSLRLDLQGIRNDDGGDLGYPSIKQSRNHKILRMSDYYRCGELFSGSEIYEFSSKSWRVLDFTTNVEIRSLINRHGQSLNGNAYYSAEEKIIMQGGLAEAGAFLLCFDFTSERFRPRLSLPFHASDEDALTIYLTKQLTSLDKMDTSNL
ncbi:PREDICTED: F-box protein At2g18780-like [Camelina sativa]|uniref:F-box protein At2g18780-like n=1 Tax=Camelina sativa TaxID=90675 RepID=A0ABM0T1D5_CAMSA|nr:PREDICTED: F-box protein At2g18780-like [Camelina sativa]